MIEQRDSFPSCLSETRFIPRPCHHINQIRYEQNRVAYLEQIPGTSFIENSRLDKLPPFLKDSKTLLFEEDSLRGWEYNSVCSLMHSLGYLRKLGFYVKLFH